VYQALGARAPDYLAQPILGGAMRPKVVPQTAYIHPRITGDMVRYFEWMGAAVYTADRRAGAMHGKQFLLDAVHAGIDATFLYGRLDFSENTLPAMDFDLVVNLESWATEESRPRRTLRLDVRAELGKIRAWKLGIPEENQPMALMERPTGQVAVALGRNFEFKVALAWLLATPSSSAPASANSLGNDSNAVTTKLRLRLSLWQSGLPADSLPEEGWMELPLLRQEDMFTHW